MKGASPTVDELVEHPTHVAPGHHVAVATAQVAPPAGDVAEPVAALLARALLRAVEVQVACVKANFETSFFTFL